MKYAGSGTLDGKISRSRIGLFCAFAAQLLLPETISAQVADQEFEQIIVTGWRIARPDFESASPIVTITGDAFERTGAEPRYRHQPAAAVHAVYHQHFEQSRQWRTG